MGSHVQMVSLVISELYWKRVTTRGRIAYASSGNCALANLLPTHIPPTAHPQNIAEAFSGAKYENHSWNSFSFKRKNLLFFCFFAIFKGDTQRLHQHNDTKFFFSFVVRITVYVYVGLHDTIFVLLFLCWFYYAIVFMLFSVGVRMHLMPVVRSVN